MKRHVVVMNGKKMNYDGALDYQLLGDHVIVYDDTDEKNFLEHASQAEIIVTKEMSVTSEMIAGLKNVQLIVEAGTGYNNIDLDAANKKHITVCNVPSYSSKRVAHTAIMGMLMLSSSMQMQLRHLERGDHSHFTNGLLMRHEELNDKTLGIVGAGHIGREVGKVAHAMGMQVIYNTRTTKDDGEEYVSLNELLKRSDYVSLHVPLNELTYHMINKDTLSLMKNNAFLINTSRGALVDEEALISSLKAKEIGGAFLDVTEVEPPEEGSPLYELENVIITPHMGWKGLETRKRLLSIVKDDIDAFDADHPINVVNEPFSL